MTDDDVPSIRQLLHDAARPANEAPDFDTARAPAEPLPLLTEWLRSAVEAGVVQPQAVVLSTSSPADGVTARTLLLKDVDEAVWFASSALSPKGLQMAVDPRVSLTAYWREQGRQVRILGVATPGPREVSRADFTARHPQSRAVASAFPQSAPIEDRHEVSSRLAEAVARVEADETWAPDDWTAYRVDPVSVEFWQATTGRDQVRLRYQRVSVGSPWNREELWP